MSFREDTPSRHLVNRSLVGNPLSSLIYCRQMQTGAKKTQLQAWGIAVLRVVAGYLFLASGVDKIFIHAPPDLGNTSPGAIAVTISLGELVCGAALVVGLLTRWVSIPLALFMLADILVIHPPYAFFEQDHGYEYALLRLAASVTLALTGSDKVALDNTLAIRRRPK
jgi:putative oxidoreductase